MKRQLFWRLQIKANCAQSVNAPDIIAEIALISWSVDFPILTERGVHVSAQYVESKTTTNGKIVPWASYASTADKEAIA